MTFKPLETKVKVEPALPIVVAAVPLVFMLVAPVAVKPPFKVARPVTPSVPPRVVAPVPTVKVLAPLILVAPLSVTVPVAVLKLPVPDCAKLPLDCV